MMKEGHKDVSFSFLKSFTFILESDIMSLMLIRKENEMAYTNLEIKVFNKVLDVCYEDYSADAKGLAKTLDLPINTVKGVLGSLVKKGKIACNEEERSQTVFLDVHAIVNDCGCSYGFENYDEEEYKQYYL